VRGCGYKVEAGKKKRSVKSTRKREHHLEGEKALPRHREKTLERDFHLRRTSLTTVKSPTSWISSEKGGVFKNQQTLYVGKGDEPWG